MYSNASNLTTDMSHGGDYGRHCAFHETFPTVIYAVLHDEDLKAAFTASAYNRNHFNFGRPGQISFLLWLNRTAPDNRPIMNHLTLVEFVLELRGMPKPCATLDMAWVR